MKKFSCFMVIVMLSLSLILVGGGYVSAKEKIVVWSWGASDTVEIGLIQNTWPVIEKEFDIKIEHEQFPGLGSAEFVVKIVNAIRFGTGPDLIEGMESSLAELAYQGFIEEVPAEVDEALQNAIVPAYQKMNYFWNPDGKKVPIMGALTRDTGGQIVWWNTEMYQEAGLDRSPLTWDEVFEFGKKLTKYDADGNIERSGFFFRTGGHPHGIADKWSPYFFSAGGESIVKKDADGNVKANINTQAAKKAVQFFLDALYKHKIDAMGIPGDIGAWRQGQTASVGARRAWVPGNVRGNAPEMYSKLAAGPIPVAEAGMDSITTYHTAGLVVNTKIDAEKKELIWKILKRLNEPEITKLRTNDTERYLVYQATVNAPPFDSQLWQDYLQACGNVRSRVETPKDETILLILGETLNLIFAQELTVDEGLARAEERMNEELEGLKFQ